MTVRAATPADIPRIVALYNASPLAQVLGLTRADGREMLEDVQRQSGRVAVNAPTANTITAVVSAFLDNSSLDPQLCFQFIVMTNIAAVRPVLTAACNFARTTYGVTRWYAAITQDPRVATARVYLETLGTYLHNDPALPGCDRGADFRMMGDTIANGLVRI